MHIYSFCLVVARLILHLVWGTTTYTHGSSASSTTSASISSGRSSPTTPMLLNRIRNNNGADQLTSSIMVSSPDLDTEMWLGLMKQNNIVKCKSAESTQLIIFTQLWSITDFHWFTYVWSWGRISAHIGLPHFELKNIKL